MEPNAPSTREDPGNHGSLVARGMDSMDTRGLENMAVRGLENMAARGLENMAARGLESMASRGLESMASRGLESMASRGLDHIPGRNLEGMMSRGMDPMQYGHYDRFGHPYNFMSPRHMDPRVMDYPTRGLDHLSQRTMEDSVPRNMISPRTDFESRTMESLQSRNIDNLYSRNMEYSTRAIDNLLPRSMENFNQRGSHCISPREMEAVSRNTEDSTVGNYSREEIGTTETKSVESTSAAVCDGSRSVDEMVALSNIHNDNHISTVNIHNDNHISTVNMGSRVGGESRPQGQRSEEDAASDMSASKLAEKVDELVQKLEDEMEDKFSDDDQKDESPPSEVNEETVKPGTTLATKFVHIIDDHSENFRHQLHQQWLKGQYCDLVIKVKDSEVKVHSCVFAAFSPVHCHPKKNNALCFPEIEHYAIAPLIKMMYTGILCFDLSVAPFVAMAAKRLMLSEVFSVCEDYITECQKSGLAHSDISPTMVESGGVQVTIKRHSHEGFSAEYCHDKSTQMSEDEGRLFDPPLRHRVRLGRPKRKPKKKYGKRGRPPKIKTEPSTKVPSSKDEGDEDVGEPATGDGEKDEELSLKDEQEQDTVEDMMEGRDESEEEEYTPGGHRRYERRRLWPRKSSAVVKWLMGRRKHAQKPKHTKRDKLGRFKCPGCTAVFSSSDDLQGHIESSSAHNAYRCTLCGVAYIRKSNLTRHMRTVHSNAFHLKCRFCNIVSKTERELRNHCVEAHDNGSPFECEQPGCNYRTYKYDFLRRHKQIHSEQKDYVCDKCGKTFSQQAGLLSHHRTCYHLQEYLCDVCGQAFNHYQSMKSHRRSIHYGERPFMCTDCGTRFSDHRNLKRHRRIHENTFPYICIICGQKYRHSNSLKAHMKKHNDLVAAEAASNALISSYASSSGDMGAAQFPSHPITAMPIPAMSLNHLHEYYAGACDKYAGACDKYAPMTSINSGVPSSLPTSSHSGSTNMSSSVGNVGLDTLANLCLSSSVV